MFYLSLFVLLSVYKQTLTPPLTHIHRVLYDGDKTTSSRSSGSNAVSNTPGRGERQRDSVLTACKQTLGMYMYTCTYYCRC